MHSRKKYISNSRKHTKTRLKTSTNRRRRRRRPAKGLSAGTSQWLWGKADVAADAGAAELEQI